MANDNKDNSLALRQPYSMDLQHFETGLLQFMGDMGLPSERILVTVRERGVVFGTIANVLEKIDESKKSRSIYISKFIAAAAAGLFDAALNYLWDETINELRNRVAQYDLSYFYDLAVNNPEKRKKLSNEEDLTRIDDSELIQGANKIGLVSDLGLKHLDFVKYMRNWASAAHPNQNQITGLQLAGWLETCIIEVIALPIPYVLIEIKKLLANIRENKISALEAQQISSFFVNLTQEQVNNLASGFFGRYVLLDTSSQTRQNILLLLPRLWGRVDEPTRNQFGTKYAKFLANNDQQQHTLARQFLEIVSGLSYIPDNVRGAEIENAIQDLLTSHRGTNNFHNEPAFAKQLQRLVGETGKVPSQINDLYIITLVEVFLSNGHGTAWNAEPIYRQLIEQFNPEQALIAILSFNNVNIASKLQFSLCGEKFHELLNTMKLKVSAPAVKEAIDVIDAYKGPLDKMKDDSRIKSKVENLKKIVANK